MLLKVNDNQISLRGNLIESGHCRRQVEILRRNPPDGECLVKRLMIRPMAQKAKERSEDVSNM